MDFFQAQDDAIRRTKRLVFYYIIALVLIVVAVYGAVTAGFLFYANMSAGDGHAGFAPQSPLWDPSRMVATAAGVLALVGLGSLFKTLSLRGGGPAVALSLGGERVDRSTRDPARRQLLNVVEEIAIASGVPVPEVFILPDEPSINAFAAGWGTADAVVAISAGALASLSRDELQGVVAHEYSHILYGDCRLNIRLIGILFGIMMLTVFGRLIGRAMRFGGRGRPVVTRGGGGRKGGGGAAILAVILVMVLVTLIGYIGTFFARLIQAAISRQREFLADAASVQFTRNPAGIAGALRKIAGHTGHGVLSHPRAGEAAHMFFADGLRQSFSSMFSTHPPLQERIRRIQPDWDGTVDLPKPRAAAPPQPRAQPPAAASATRPVRPGLPAVAVLAAIGTMTGQHLAMAGRLMAAIPAELDARLREPSGARNAVLALIIADNEADDSRQLEILSTALPQQQQAAVRELVAMIRALPRQARLAVLELASTTLVQAGSRLDGLDSLVDRLVMADRRTSLYECCFRRILRERTSRVDRPAGGHDPVSYMQLEPAVARAVATLLRRVAREAAQAEDPDALAARSVKGLYLLQDKVGLSAATDAESDDLDAALDILAATAYAIRAQVLKAVVACIREDGELSPAEAEVIRLLTLSLDCPAPVVG